MTVGLICNVSASGNESCDGMHAGSKCKAPITDEHGGKSQEGLHSARTAGRRSAVGRRASPGAMPASSLLWATGSHLRAAFRSLRRSIADGSLLCCDACQINVLYVRISVGI